MNVDRLKNMYSMIGMSTRCESDEEILAKKDDLEYQLIKFVIHLIRENKKTTLSLSGDSLLITNNRSTLACLFSILERS